MNRAYALRSEPFELLEFEYEPEVELEVSRSSRDYVRWLQKALNRILGRQLAVDGMLGAQSRAALREFQRRSGLSADGIPGPRTEQALIAAGSGNPPGGSVASSSASAASASRPATSAAAATSLASGEFITIRSGVRLMPEVARVVRELDGEFRAASLRVVLTSGFRTPEDQLRIIREQAIRRGLHEKYPQIQTATVDNVESWLDAWDELLHRAGYIVNPPRDVRSRITGKFYRPSPHTRGEAFDLSGAELSRIADVVRNYCRRGGSISQILIEPKNNAVHIGVGPNRGC
jgi:peptidoglycan hydrolase-like protein with peptidoglycan-binding domain